MKKIILILSAIAIFNLNSKAQVIVDDININEAGVNTIELLAVLKSYVEYSFYVDYGVKLKLFKKQQFKDKDGNVQDFDTPIKALNFFMDNGWELSQYTRVSSSVSYILCLKKD